MPDTAPATRPALAQEAKETLRHMRAIESGLAASGLTTHLTDARAGLDLTATLSPARRDHPPLPRLHPPATPPRTRPRRNCLPSLPTPASTSASSPAFCQPDPLRPAPPDDLFQRRKNSMNGTFTRYG